MARSSRSGQRMKFGLWNVRSCRDECKLDEIETQLWQRGFEATVLTETNLLTCSRVINNRSTLYNSGPGANESNVGGVGFLVRNEGLTVLGVDYISNRIATLKLQVGGIKLGIVACYAPTECSRSITGTEKDEYFEKLREISKALSEETTEVLLMGDFNCRINRWARNDLPRIVGPFANDVDTTENGYRVLELCHALDMRIENSFYEKSTHKQATWYHPRTKKGAMLDLILSRNLARVRTTDIRASRGAEANSDHVLVTIILRIDEGPARPLKGAKSKPSRKILWSSKEVARTISKKPKLYADNLAERVDTSANLMDLTKSMELATKHYLTQVRIRKHEKTVIMTRKLRQMIKEKHEVRRKWLSQKTERAWDEYKEKRNKVKGMMKKAKENAIDRLMTDFRRFSKANDTQLAYEKLNEALKMATGAWPHQHKEQNLISTELLQQHYHQLFSARNTTDILDTAREPDDGRLGDLTMSELEQVLSSLKNGKAPGINGIRSELIKHGGDHLKLLLLKLFNQYWSGETDLPVEWRDSEVISIYKRKGDKSDPNNYRSIFLLDTIGKVFAGVVCRKLIPWSEPFLSDSQMGFRKCFSTTQAILCVRHVIQNALDQDCPLILAFVDLKKAFDSVSHRDVIESLRKIDCPTRIINCIKQMMNKPKGLLRDSDKSFHMERGVRQGSKEGPHLFNIVFDLILREVMMKAKITVEMKSEIGNWVLEHIEYADDLCLFASSVDEMKGVLNVLNEVLVDHSMEMSFTKTKWMAISKVPLTGRIEICGQEIEKVDSFRYLGSIIRADGCASDAVSSNTKSAILALIKLRPALRSNHLTIRAKVNLIESYVKPILLYGLETIVLTAQLNDKLEAILNKARRMTLGITNKRDMKVRELAERIPLKGVATQLQKRRVALWMSVRKRPDHLTWRVMRSKLAQKRSYRKAHTKCWIRQLERDAKECGVESPNEWICNPHQVEIPSINTRPKLVGVREREIVCTDPNCERMFATKKEMYRHVRMDHVERETRVVNSYSCPVMNCLKTYKTLGWLKNHLQKCHPNSETGVTETPNNERPIPSGHFCGGYNDNGRDDRTDETDDRNLNEKTLHYCPIENCEKVLPTRKGMINHCYRVHSFSLIANRPTVKGKRQTVMSVP